MVRDSEVFLMSFNSFRVVARVLGGRVALVCLGTTRAEALARARAAALPADTLGLRLQQWAGWQDAGRWQDVAGQHVAWPGLPAGRPVNGGPARRSGRSLVAR
jgi:hypothetical protein